MTGDTGGPTSGPHAAPGQEPLLPADRPGGAQPRGLPWPPRRRGDHPRGPGGEHRLQRHPVRDAQLQRGRLPSLLAARRPHRAARRRLRHLRLRARRAERHPHCRPFRTADARRLAHLHHPAVLRMPQGDAPGRDQRGALPAPLGSRPRPTGIPRWPHSTRRCARASSTFEQVGDPAMDTPELFASLLPSLSAQPAGSTSCSRSCAWLSAMAATRSRVSISSTGLSCRQRAMRGKRSA